MKKLLFTIAVVSSCCARGQLFDTSMWVPNGPVYDMLQRGNELFIGGDFDYVGKAIGYGFPVDTVNLQVISPGFPRVDGEVYCVAPDCWGGWYIGGSFTAVGGQPRINLAHVARSGYLYPNFNPMPDGPVYALWVQETPRTGVWHTPNVYAGGDFTFIGGASRSNLAVLNPYTGLAYPNWSPDVDGTVYAISPKNSYSPRWGEFYTYSVYIGGDFQNVDGASRTYFAEISMLIGQNNGHALRPLNLIFNGPVRCIRHSMRNLYIGGEFTLVNNQQKKFLVKYDQVFGGISPTFVADVSGPVFCFGRYGLQFSTGSSGPPPPGKLVQTPSLQVHSDDTSLLIGGSFAIVNGQQRNNFAELDTATGTLLSLVINTDAPVYAIELSKRDKDIYLGGAFLTVNSQPRRHMAALDSDGVVKPQVLDLSDPVRGLSLNDTLLYIAGEFVCYNGVLRNNLAAIDLTTRTASSFSLGADDYVTSLALTPDGKLFAGGNFHALGGQPRDHLGGIDLNTLTVLPLTANTDGLVRTLCLLNNKLYFGGLFTDVNGTSRQNLAAVDYVSGQLQLWSPNANGTVNSMKAGADRLFIGGFYSSIGGFSRNNLAAVDTLGGYCITAFNPDVNNGIYSLTLNGNRLNIGGWFTQAGGNPRNRIAGVDANSAAVIPFNPDADSYVRSVFELDNSTLVLGGQFGSVGGQPRNRLAFVDMMSGTLLPFDPSANRIPFAYSRNGNILYTGGAFTTMGGMVHPFLVALNLQYVPGYSEQNPPEGFSLWPNPASSTVYYSWDYPGGAGSIRIFSIEGKELISREIRDGSGSLDISGLPTGLYIVRLTAPGSAGHSARLVITR